MKKIAIILTIILTMASFNAFAEGGADRVIERNAQFNQGR